MIARARLGRLGCARGPAVRRPRLFVLRRVRRRPTVPVRLHDAGPEKVAWNSPNPRVCVEWDDVVSQDHWASVIAFGRYEELPDTPEYRPARRQAHRLFQKHAVWWEPVYAAYAARASRDPTQTYNPLYYRIHIDQMTGHGAHPRRRAGPQPPRGR